MIPDDIKQLLHEIRLLGGTEETYNTPDDWQLIRNILKSERDRANKKADEYVREAQW